MSSVESRVELDTLQKINQLMETGLDQRALPVIFELLEYGVHPDAIVDIIESLRSDRTVPDKP